MYFVNVRKKQKQKVRQKHRRINRGLLIQVQPDDVTCGPTCLHAVYGYFGDQVPLQDVIAQVPSLPQGGTLAVHLACHALRRGYAASIYTFNVQMFDPTWFCGRDCDIAEKLRQQARHKSGKRLALATEAYLEYLRLGGTLHFQNLTTQLLRRFLNQGTPVLTGLSATYLYACARERELSSRRTAFDDVRGVPTGHFVVLTGYDKKKRLVRVADPFKDNPWHGHSYYSVAATRIINAIMLGVVTYDANLLIIQPEPPVSLRSTTANTEAERLNGAILRTGIP